MNTKKGKTMNQAPPNKNEGLQASLALAYAAALVRDDVQPEAAIKMGVQIFATLKIEASPEREPAIMKAAEWAIDYARARAINDTLNATLLETAAKELLKAYGGLR